MFSTSTVLIWDVIFVVGGYVASIFTWPMLRDWIKKSLHIS